jgi:hypothetical protein
MVRRQRGERIPHQRIEPVVERPFGGGVLPSVRPPRWQPLSHFVVEEIWLALPESVDVGVTEDRQQPGPRVAAVETVEATVGAEQRVLDEILRTPALPGRLR